MALSEQEEFELLSLERERALAGASPRPQPAASAPPPQEEKPSIWKRADALLRNATPLGLMMGGVASATTNMNDLINKAGYEAGGYATDVAANLGATPNVAAGVGTAINAGVQGLPMIAGGEAAKAAGPMLDRQARKYMQSAIKPIWSDLRKSKAAEAIDTMLKEGISVDVSGITKLKDKIGDLNREVAALIASSPSTVNKYEVAKENEELATLERD